MAHDSCSNQLILPVANTLSLVRKDARAAWRTRARTYRDHGGLIGRQLALRVRVRVAPVARHGWFNENMAHAANDFGLLCLLAIIPSSVCKLRCSTHGHVKCVLITDKGRYLTVVLQGTFIESGSVANMIFHHHNTKKRHDEMCPRLVKLIVHRHGC